MDLDIVIGKAKRPKGFTLIELMIAISIIAILMTIAMPNYAVYTIRGKEAVLKENLSTLREVLDHFKADNGFYPETLQDLVEKQYIRSIPLDPMTNSTETWILILPPNKEESGIYDIHSGSDLVSLSGILYNEW
jgi:general secretion pathway protein G